MMPAADIGDVGIAANKEKHGGQWPFTSPYQPLSFKSKFIQFIYITIKTYMK